MQYNYKFSVIIPIYNVEKLLAETIESVINQSIGFEKNIQLILINDGSPDNSEDICMSYKKRFPDNIFYVKKENGGVSSARNLGLEYAEGKYINFLDSDDKWEPYSFEKAYKYFEKHYDEIDVLAARVQFFEAKTAYHSLDYKFDKGTRIIDVNSEKDLFCVQSTSATTFIKAEAIGDLRYDGRLKYGEDSTFINKLIIKKCRYGVIKEALYRYRRRRSGDSAVNVQLFDKSLYINSLLYYHKELFDYSQKLYGKIIPYIQSIVGYDVMWRFANPNVPTVLNEEEQEEYYKRLKEILLCIDDKILLTSPVHKLMTRKRDAIRYKYGVDLLKEMKLNDKHEFCFNSVPVLDMSYNLTRNVVVASVDIDKTVLKVDMLVDKWITDGTSETGRVYAKLYGKTAEPVEITEYRGSVQHTTDGDVYNYKLYKFEIDLLDKLKVGKRLEFKPFVKYDSAETSLSMNYMKTVPASIRYGTIYKFIGVYGVKCFRTVIDIYYPKNKALTRLEWDIQCLLCLIKRGRPDIFLKKHILFPLFKKREAKKGRIWLVSDRIDNAGDNGEVFFKYLCANKPEGVRPIFVIGKEASDEVKSRLRSIGEVVNYEDKRYREYFLMAEKIISSSAGAFTINAFGKDINYYVDLYNFKFYYLQHGVACADLSKWLNRYAKNIHMFFTSSQRERLSIIEGDYNYAEENVVLTGQARFDALYEDTQKTVLILPTWRREYAECYDEKTSSVYSSSFKNTEFYRFYNGLINNDRLLSAMREKGYKGLFCLHPIFMKQYVDFEANDIFSVNEGYIDYNKVFAEAALMVTDYSSVVFDYAYLRKPIIYSQFDKEEFFETQIYDEGYFSYENDGFGPVCTDIDKTVDEIVSLIENDCVNPEKYAQRINRFFAFDDRNNSQRILEAIISDDNNK